MKALIEYLLRAAAIVIAVVLHQYVLALASTRFGDLLPRKKGRLTLNPLKQMDLLGFLLMLFAGFGWGNPVETSPMYYKDRRRDTVIIYAMPSLVNLFVGAAFSIVSAVMKRTLLSGALPYDIWIYAYQFAGYIALYNLSLAFFNIIPVYPLDGAKVLSMFVSAGTAMKINQYEKILQIGLMLLVFLGFVGRMLNPLIYLIMRAF